VQNRLQKRPHLIVFSCSVPAQDLPVLLTRWLDTTRSGRCAKSTYDSCDLIVCKLIWCLAAHGHSVCGADEIEAFMAYLVAGHECPNGGWDTDRYKADVHPSTSRTY